MAELHGVTLARQGDVTAPPRVLIVGPAWAGDMVMAQSLFLALRSRFPGCAIDVLAPEWTLPLLERMPEVRAAIPMPLGHGQFGLRDRWQLGSMLRGLYDWAIVLPNSWKSSLIPFFARIPLRTGYMGEWRIGLLNDIRHLDKTRLPRTVQRFVALGLDRDAHQPPPCPAPRLMVTAGGPVEAGQRLGLQTGGSVLALCPGAEYGPAKCWPTEHFAAVARAKLQTGWRVWLFGSARDMEAASAIEKAAPGSINLAGKTRLAEAVDLLALSTAVVSNDSGLMHVAAALDKPLVAVYGSSDPGFTPPLSERARIVRLGLECSPCFRRVCPYGHTRCLSEIHPEQVLAELEAACAS